MEPIFEKGALLIVKKERKLWQTDYAFEPAVQTQTIVPVGSALLLLREGKAKYEGWYAEEFRSVMVLYKEQEYQMLIDPNLSLQDLEEEFTIVNSI